MTKRPESDILNVLKDFQIAGQMSQKSDVINIKEHQTKELSKVVSFVFLREMFYIVIDNTADDDTNYLLDIIKTINPDAVGAFIKNPNDTITTYGLRYKYKDYYLFRATPVKIRLDIELTKRYPDISRSLIQKYIKLGMVRVNNKLASSAKQEVGQQDDIAINFPNKLQEQKHNIPIIYLDDDIVVINKPCGVLSHSKGAQNSEYTVADLFRQYTTFALDTNRPGIVHRLDRATSGVMIGARNEESANNLKKQFAKRMVKKTYQAVLDGAPKNDEAIIDLPIGRNPKKPSTFRVDPKGKSAITRYKIIKHGKDKTLVELYPKTGRTHQLRVHMSYIGTPILGDTVYGHKNVLESRLYLHAQSISITPLSSSKTQTFSADLPTDFTEAVNG